MNAIGYEVRKVTSEGRVILLTTKWDREEAASAAQAAATEVHEGALQLAELHPGTVPAPTVRGSVVDLHGLHDYNGCGEAVRSIEVVRVIDYDALPFKVLFAGDPMPSEVTSSIFLAGARPFPGASARVRRTLARASSGMLCV